MAKLLLKYYEPEQGEILIDGVDINEISNKSLRKAVSYVPQTIELFSKSIYDNIRVSRMSATLEEVKEAAKAADAHDFIKRLPMQYYTFLEAAVMKHVGTAAAAMVSGAIDFAFTLAGASMGGLIAEALDRLDGHNDNYVFT